MDLETLLPAIRTLQHLPQLVAVLGHQPLWEKLPGQQQPSPREGEVTVVGSTGHLPWFAIETSRAEHDAVRMARQISGRGRPCLVLALDSRAQRLAIAAGFGACPSLELDLASPTRQALIALRRLRIGSEAGALAFAARAAEALAAEAVGRRFFQQFRQTLDRLSAGIRGAMHAEDRRNLALLQLTRVLFLYFIQTKG